MRHVTFIRTVLIIVSLAVASCSAVPQTDNTNLHESERTELSATIARMDSTLFARFNARDLVGMTEFLDSSLEVYQDNTGVRKFGETTAAFAGLFKKDYVLTRTLIPSSLEVYPIKGFGAIETGRHTFTHTENGELVSGTFKFLHIWQRQPTGWKITRIVTYDH